MINLFHHESDPRAPSDLDRIAWTRLVDLPIFLVGLKCFVGEMMKILDFHAILCPLFLLIRQLVEGDILDFLVKSFSSVFFKYVIESVLISHLQVNHAANRI